MPLRLAPPRKGYSPNWTVRGTYLGVRVNRTSGSPKRAVAKQLRDTIEADIERGQRPGVAIVGFADAALAYVKATGNRRYVMKLAEHFGATAVTAVDQAAIDAAAVELYPNVTPATRNVCVYTPVSAILHHANVDIKLRRPKGAKGRVRTEYLNPPDAAAIVGAANAFDAEFALLLQFLLYTGCRLGEALALTWDQIVDGTAYVATSKNDDPRTVLLRGELRDAMEAHRKPEGRVFRFRQGGHLKELLKRATRAACGLAKPPRWKPGTRRRLEPWRLSFVNFHTFCHTWATWMRRYGGADLQGLVGTGRWRDARSAARYAHIKAHEEWARVERLPAMPGVKSVKST
jgi:integrase